MFTENILNYYKVGDIGKCPKCKNHLKLEVIKTPIRDNTVVYCPICKKEEYFTGTCK